MCNWHKKIAVFALLLILPLQGMAAVLMPIACFSAPAHSTTASAHHQPATNNAHDHDAHAARDKHASASQHQNSNDNDSNGGQQYNGHLCCHLFSAIPAAEAVVAASDLPLLISSIPALVALFVPEQLQRPPRA